MNEENEKLVVALALITVQNAMHHDEDTAMIEEPTLAADVATPPVPLVFEVPTQDIVLAAMPFLPNAVAPAEVAAPSITCCYCPTFRSSSSILWC